SFRFVLWDAAGTPQCGVEKPMMRKLSVLFLLLIASLAFAQSENPTLRKEIQAVYTSFDKMVAAGDVKGICALLDPSFIATDLNGKTTNAAEAKKEMANMMKTIRDQKSQITVNQIQEQGGEVVAWVTMRASGKIKQGDKWVPMVLTQRFA